METNLSIKEKFKEVVGNSFLLFEDKEYPAYIIELDPKHIMVLVDLTEFDSEVEWKPYSALIPDVDVLRYKTDSFRVYFINKILEILNPDEYGFIQKKKHWYLIFKRGNYGVMLAPSIDRKDQGEITETSEEFEDIIKKIASSVCEL